MGQLSVQANAVNGLVKEGSQAETGSLQIPRALRAILEDHGLCVQIDDSSMGVPGSKPKSRDPRFPKNPNLPPIRAFIPGMSIISHEAAPGQFGAMMTTSTSGHGTTHQEALVDFLQNLSGRRVVIRDPKGREVAHINVPTLTIPDSRVTSEPAAPSAP